jgi:hypothetical protein
MPADGKLIEMHVAELKQLLNVMDPSPFHDRGVDRAAGGDSVAVVRRPRFPAGGCRDIDRVRMDPMTYLRCGDG